MRYRTIAPGATPALKTSRALATTSGGCRLRRAPERVAGAALVLALLSGCSTDGASDTVSSSRTAAAGISGSAATGDAAGASATSASPVETDSVQTDAPVTTASVIVTSADASAGGIQAAAFVQGLVEIGGTCTLTAAQDGDEVRGKAAKAEPGPSTTDCGPLSLSVPNVASGAWQVSVTYSSPTTELTSTTTEVQVP